MKKILTALSFTLIFCLGLFSFTACDDFKDAEPISVNTYLEYINKDEVIKTFPGCKVKIDGDGNSNGSIEGTVVKINGNITAIAKINFTSATEGIAKFDMFVYQNKIYIDNGIEKYWLAYSNNLYPSGSNEELNIVKYYATTLVGYLDMTTTLTSIDEIANDCTVRRQNSQENINFIIEAKQESTMFNEVMTVEGTTKIYFKNNAINKYIQISTVKSNNVTQTTNATVELYSGTISNDINLSEYSQKL